MATAPQTERTRGPIASAFRYTGAFLKGSVLGFLEGMSTFGRKGAWAGAGLGILFGIASGAMVYYVGAMALGGFLAGAGLGAVGGSIKGAYSNVMLQHRRDKYSHEVEERQEARAAREARSQTFNYGYNPHAANAERQRVTNYNFERQLQQERENDRDFRTFWQDRVDGPHNGSGRGM